jgi:hypothetical protein
MNSHKETPGIDTQVDNLFRQALKPFAEAAPRRDGWERIVADLHMTPHRRILRWLKGLRRTPELRRLLFWVDSINTFYATSPSQPFCIEPGGRCHPSPFVGLMAKQVLDLRLAS